jgi:hypothetical protein
MITCYHSILNLLAHIFEGTLGKNCRVGEPSEFEEYRQALGRVEQEEKKANERRKGVEVASKAIKL